MKMVVIILILIIALSLLGLVIFYLNTKDKSLSEYALIIQAIASVILVIVTGFYAYEARLSRISQEQGFNKYVAELQEARKQQVKPYVYIFFYWGGETFGSKFFTVLKNLGAGPAFDINYSYLVIDDKGQTISHEDKCPALGVSAETADNTPFSTEHINMKNKVKVEINYKDSFGKRFTDTFELSLRELANNPPPCDFGDHLRKLEKEESSFDRRIRIETFLQTFKALQQDVSEIKDSIKNK